MENIESVFLLNSGWNWEVKKDQDRDKSWKRLWVKKDEWRKLCWEKIRKRLKMRVKTKRGRKDKWKRNRKDKKVGAVKVKECPKWRRLLGNDKRR